MSAQAEIIVSGDCPSCSWSDHRVFHTVPWCPKVPALLEIDSNGGDLQDDGSYVRCGGTTRPVEVGEFVLIIDHSDGPLHSFVTWGQVVYVGAGQSRTIVEAREVGRTPGNGWLYIDAG